MADRNSITTDLAARLVQITGELHPLAYARVDANLSIAQVSPNISSVLSDSDRVAAGVPLTDALEEFFGMEETFRAILRNEIPLFKIERVNRFQPDGSPRYLTFHVLPFDPNQTDLGLVVIFEDVTQFGIFEQSLLQKRNEVGLLQDALAGVNAELDQRVKLRTAELETAKQQIEKQLFRFQALRANDLAILGATDLRLALKTIAEQIKKQLLVDLVSILLFNPHLLALEASVSIGTKTHDLRNARIRLGETLIGRAALERRLLAFPSPMMTAIQEDKWVKDENLQACYVLPLVAKGNTVGVLFLGNRSEFQPDREWLDFLEALAGQVAMAIESIKSFEDLQRSNLELALAYSRTIEGWSHALDLRDKETKDHTSRVTETTILLARMSGMNDAEIMHVRHGALLHDIGKMGIPDAILLKDDYLTNEEWEIMHKHPTYAHEMLFPIEYLRPALDIPYCHHERWDGTGYPRGLKGNEIPLAARLFAVVDVWDALCSDRPYRKGWPADKVREYIISQAGTHFDPQAVDLFIRHVMK